MNRLTLDEIKNKVSIAEFIKFRSDLGFQLKKDGKHINAFIPIKDKSGQHVYKNRKIQKESNILITRIEKKVKGNYQQQDTFFDLTDFDKTKPKSILDFVHIFVLRNQPNSKPDFGQITGVLYDYIFSKAFIDLNDSSIELSLTKTSSSKTSSKKAKISLPTKSTFDYLKSRKISQETYTDPVFIGTYGSYNEINETDKIFIENKPAFPIITKDNKLQTVQWINFDGTKHNGKYLVADIPRNNSLFKSNNQKDTNTAIITESPEKCMAHYQLFRSDMYSQRIRPKYYSSLGNFTKNDLAHLNTDLTRNSINHTIFAFDNDREGAKYTLGALFYFSGIDVNHSVKETQNNLIFTILAPPEETDNYNYDKAYNLLTKQGFQIKKENKKLMLETTLENFWNKINSNHFSTHVSIKKDFLDDLADNIKLPKKFTNTTNQNLL